jgi:hypothetical protein
VVCLEIDKGVLKVDGQLVGLLGLDHDVIDVSFKVAPNLTFEAFLHAPLEGVVSVL